MIQDITADHRVLGVVSFTLSSPFGCLTPMWHPGLLLSPDAAAYAWDLLFSNACFHKALKWIAGIAVMLFSGSSCNKNLIDNHVSVIETLIYNNLTGASAIGGTVALNMCDVDHLLFVKISKPKTIERMVKCQCI